MTLKHSKKNNHEDMKKIPRLDKGKKLKLSKIRERETKKELLTDETEDEEC